MSVNEIFIAEIANRSVSFTLVYSNPNGAVDFTLSAYSLDSYEGRVDFRFEDLPAAVSYFKAHGNKLCQAYNKILGYCL